MRNRLAIGSKQMGTLCIKPEVKLPIRERLAVRQLGNQVGAIGRPDMNETMLTQMLLELQVRRQ